MFINLLAALALGFVAGYLARLLAATCLTVLSAVTALVSDAIAYLAEYLVEFFATLATMSDIKEVNFFIGVAVFLLCSFVFFHNLQTTGSLIS